MEQHELERMGAAAGKAAQLMKVLSHEGRLLVLCHLIEGEKSVGELSQRVGLGMSALSQHLAMLRELGLVETRRQSQTIHYRISSDEAARVISLLHDIYCR